MFSKTTARPEFKEPGAISLPCSTYLDPSQLGGGNKTT